MSQAGTGHFAAEHEAAIAAFHQARREYPGRPLHPLVRRRFRLVIRQYYRHAGRSLPWRGEPTPYAVFVSEVMLQQTQAERVVGKYLEFLQLFPDFESLARSPVRDVLSAWSGLGYNRRALALRESARIIVEELGGVLPSRETELRRLPGVGPYTRGALLAFAYQRPRVFIETNIRTVFIHFFFRGGKMIDDRRLMPIIESCLDRQNPREWYYALMDYGAKLKREGVRVNHRNPGYRPQPPFRGSNRELRGKILKTLTVKRSVTVEQLTSALSAEQAAVKRNICKLESEGFVQLRGGRIRVRST